MPYDVMTPFGGCAEQCDSLLVAKIWKEEVWMIQNLLVNLMIKCLTLHG